MSLRHSNPVDCPTWDPMTIAAMRADYIDTASFTAMLTRLAARAGSTDLPRSTDEPARAGEARLACH